MSECVLTLSVRGIGEEFGDADRPLHRGGKRADAYVSILLLTAYSPVCFRTRMSYYTEWGVHLSIRPWAAETVVSAETLRICHCLSLLCR